MAVDHVLSLLRIGFHVEQGKLDLLCNVTVGHAPRARCFERIIAVRQMQFRTAVAADHALEGRSRGESIRVFSSRLAWLCIFWMTALRSSSQYVLYDLA